MKKFLTVATILATMLVTVVPADAWVGVGPGRRGVGVGGWGRVGRPVARPYVRPSPYRPFVGPVVR